MQRSAAILGKTNMQRCANVAPRRKTASGGQVLLYNDFMVLNAGLIGKIISNNVNNLQHRMICADSKLAPSSADL